MSINTLLIEDDAELAGSLSDYLTEVGFDVDFAYNGQQALDILQKNHYDVILMDVQMPNVDGVEACRRIRQELHLSTPILFLTARDTLEDKLEGFSAGGDDYLVKPFAPEEVAVRLKSLNARPKLHNDNKQVLGELTIDHPLRRAIREEHPIELHDIQFRLLVILANNAPEMVTKAVLEEKLWQGDPPNCDALRTHIYRLRMAIDKPFSSELIKTIHGKGYRLAIPH